jgi:hypothetical protein
VDHSLPHFGGFAYIRGYLFNYPHQTNPIPDRTNLPPYPYREMALMVFDKEQRVQGH